MRQLLDLASENTALKRELAQVRGEAAALKRYLVEVHQILGDPAVLTPCGTGSDNPVRADAGRHDAG
jgi:hypothetical protein